MRRHIVVDAVVVTSLWSALFLPGVTAQQPRTAADGIYTTAQAARGATLYQATCAGCHGNKLEGAAAPPLAGDAFLGTWGAQPLSDLVDKVHHTMPAGAPGSLTMAQVGDVIAVMLQESGLPAGPAALDAASAPLKQVYLAPRAASAAPTPGAAPTFPATGNLNQLMRGILFPSSNVLFDVQTQDPGARRAGAHADAATTSMRYGDVYEPWQVVDAAAIALAESASLLLTPGRRCENGKPAPVDRADWQRYAQDLAAVGREAYRASQTRNQETLSEVTNKVSEACANCHRVYRDVPAAEGRCATP